MVSCSRIRELWFEFERSNRSLSPHSISVICINRSEKIAIFPSARNSPDTMEKVQSFRESLGYCIGVYEADTNETKLIDVPFHGFHTKAGVIPDSIQFAL